MDKDLEEFTLNFLLDLILIKRGETEYLSKNYTNYEGGEFKWKK